MKILVALALTAICSIAPGFFFVRRLHWSPLEKLNGAVGLSLVLVYCASFLVYATHADSRLYWAISAASVILGLVAWRDFARLFRARQVRRALAVFGLLLGWCLAVLLLIRHYSGGGWGYDWSEHFQRALFFRDYLPLDTRFGVYHLAARPPMMNVLAAFVLAQTGGGFETFSAIFTFLNVLAVLPCALLMRLFGGRYAPLFLLAPLFACNPAFVENATYTWTKLLAAFFVLFGIWLYLAGSRKKDGVRTVAAFIALAAGLLVHYSVGPYLVVIAAHYGVRVVTESRWREAVIGAAISLTLVATWIGWSVANYGATATLKTNTSVTAAEEWKASGHSTTEKVLANLASSILPHPLIPSASMDFFPQKSRAGYVRDYTFLLYQTNVVFGIGLIGGPLVLFLIWRALKKQLFWQFFLPAAIILGVAVHGERDVFGVAHVTLQPIVLLGITFLAARFAYLGAMRWLIVVGCLLDVSLGALLQTRVQSLDRDTGTFGFAIADSSIDWQTTLSRPTLANWYEKEGRATLAEILQRPEVKAKPELEAAVSAQLASLRDNDKRWWGGWFARNGDRIAFLGDYARPYATLIYVVLAGLLGMFLTILIRAASLPAVRVSRPARPSGVPPRGRPRGARSRPRRSR